METCRGLGPHSQAPSACLHGHQTLWVRVGGRWACAWMELDVSNLVQCLPEPGGHSPSAHVPVLMKDLPESSKRLSSNTPAELGGGGGELSSAGIKAAQTPSSGRLGAASPSPAPGQGPPFLGSPALPCQHTPPLLVQTWFHLSHVSRPTAFLLSKLLNFPHFS